MKNLIKTSHGIAIIGTCFLIALFFISTRDTLQSPEIFKPADFASSSSIEKYSGEEYVNTTYKFSIRIPEGFKVREMVSENVHTILIENEKGGDIQGIQILISPFRDIHELTAEMIRRDLPDLKISDWQTVAVVDDYLGVYFKSANPAFAEASREIWFVFQGNLFQLSTYEKFDGLLKNIFSTWKFTL